MKENEEKLIKISAAIIITTAHEYLNRHNLKADPVALSEACQSQFKIYFPIALKDAKEALECGADPVVEATFKASLIEAGIQAAKEAGVPQLN